MDKFNEFYENLELQCLSLQEVAELSYAAGQQSRQAEVDELNQLYLKAQHQEIRHRTIAQDALALNEEKDKRIETALAIVSKMAKATNSTAMWAYNLEKALRGEHE